MPALGAGGVDLRNIIGNVFSLFKSRANLVCTAPCDGFVLKMHYRWTFCLFLACFFTVWYQWYHREIITCVSHYNADTQVRMDYINICLSYPYVEKGDKKRYLLFYRWISWCFLLMAGIFYIPRKASKTIENPKVKKLFEDLAANSFRYDHTERELMEKAAKYIVFNLKTHNALYYKNLALNIGALGIDIFAMNFIDFVLQGRFMSYGILAYPFTRDPEEFTDYISETFPPFASCLLSKENQLVAKRAETFGCHLTFMELYEKIFLFIWFWLIFLVISTVSYIIFLLCMNLPCLKHLLLKSSKPIHANDKISSIVNGVCNNCKIGDVYILYRLRRHLSHARFLELLLKLSDPELCKLGQQPLSVNMDTEKFKKNPVETLRNRKPSASHVPPISQDILQQLLANSDMINRSQPGTNLERNPLLQKNTSILIE